MFGEKHAETNLHRVKMQTTHLIILLQNSRTAAWQCDHEPSQRWMSPVLHSWLQGVACCLTTECKDTAIVASDNSEQGQQPILQLRSHSKINANLLGVLASIVPPRHVFEVKTELL